MERKYVVITRSNKDNRILENELEKKGYFTYSFPCIATAPRKLDKVAQKILRQSKSYDWILFTSVRGVHYFFQALQELSIDVKTLEKVKIGVVGSQTAKAAHLHNIPVSLLPKNFTTKSLGNSLSDIQNKKILLPRADIASVSLTKQLIAKGARVTNLTIYTTSFPKTASQQLDSLLKDKKVACIFFASPSAVRGFMKNSKSIKQETYLSLPVISIGPVTTKTLVNCGFENIRTAKIHTIEGMLSLLKQSSI